MSFDEKYDPHIRLKKLVCQKMGLLDTESITLSYQGKSLKATDKLAQITRSDSLTTIHVNMALPGGATT